MTIKDRFTAVAQHFKISISQLEKQSGLSNGYINNIRNSISDKKLEQIANSFPEVDKVWLKMGIGEMLSNNTVAKGERNANVSSDTLIVGEMPGPGKTNAKIDLGNDRFVMLVPLVPIKAYAGYIDNFNNQEFFEGLGVHALPVTNNYKGNYMAFVVKGESMSDGTDDSINEGNIVTGREIQRHHWRNKLHLHRFEDYVIIHRDGIVTKRIISHNVENGIITCHSLNPDKRRFPDYDIQLDECLQIFNIVAVTKTK